MGPSRGLALAALFALLAPSVASAQGTGNPPPPGGGAQPAPAGGATDNGSAAGAAGAAADKKPASSGNVGGVTFQDKPARRAPVSRAVLRRSGPIATFPGFEQLPDGGSRLFVQLSQSVPVEERRAQGSVTYVLKGAHLRVHNDANALVTVHFNTPVFRARLAPQGNDLLFILEMRSAATPTFKLSDNQDKSSTLQIDFPKGDFLTGDGSATLPSETPPTRALGRVPKTKGQKGQNGAPAPTPTPDTQAPANDPGPNP
ncbi:MAG: hypothetical protein JWO86_4331 [Myxococcaceae bacterium]|nr:hypothetical protein [Myxococcaceae bacterium]